MIVFVLARTHTIGRSTNINRYKQHDMLPHHRSWYTYKLCLNNCGFSEDITP